MVVAGGILNLTGGTINVPNSNMIGVESGSLNIISGTYYHDSSTGCYLIYIHGGTTKITDGTLISRNAGVLWIDNTNNYSITIGTNDGTIEGLGWNPTLITKKGSQYLINKGSGTSTLKFNWYDGQLVSKTSGFEYSTATITKVGTINEVTNRYFYNLTAYGIQNNDSDLYCIKYLN